MFYTPGKLICSFSVSKSDYFQVHNRAKKIPEVDTEFFLSAIMSRGKYSVDKLMELELMLVRTHTIQVITIPPRNSNNLNGVRATARK